MADSPGRARAAPRRPLPGWGATRARKAAIMNTASQGTRTAAWVAGSDAPERKEVRIGFMPLTDCSSLVMAAEQKFDEKYGIKILLSKEASWAAVRDKLVNGELDAAHVLYGLVYGVHMGIGGPKKDMAALMTLNNNGQGISLSSQMRDVGVSDGQTLARAVAANPSGTYTFAQTFPTGTHAMWLYYWLAAFGINPFRDVKSIVVPPPQMIDNCRVGNMHGFCVGEPWNQRGIADGVSFSVASSQDVWADHPEKVLGTTADWADRHPNTARALTAAVLEASRWIDASASHRRRTAETVAAKPYINTDMDVILGRMLGRYEDGLGRSWEDPNAMKFFNDGAVNFPYLSDGMWFLTQHRRWGLLGEDPDYRAVARAINRIDIYTQAATAAGVALPASDMRSHRLMDGVVWNGNDPARYASAFNVNNLA
ncbi:MAG: ABC transporter substrate-binding protein [Gammaproteobacteria bacterium]|nr:ABC transporter substrate-binding protein [Gammaproteobacteria bacterium]MBU0771930.1 ABC transporter substrate-binding protein [Gammaproteobacteria bacterium]MBU0855493.1 ABC transporter substrate-binding protein [Gammaproteobacteria bacterium]MBU1845691.1 ABC transporter substrate-binding protein [Gammaproteobacteria bacterium]